MRPLTLARASGRSIFDIGSSTAFRRLPRPRSRRESGGNHSTSGSLTSSRGRDLNGYVRGVKWQALYPGMKLVADSMEAGRWSRALDLPFHEATVETNGHNI